MMCIAGPTQEANNASQQGAEVAAVCAHNGPLLCGCRLVEEVHQLPNQDLVPNKHKNKWTFLIRVQSWYLHRASHSKLHNSILDQALLTERQKTMQQQMIFDSTQLPSSL